MDQLEDKNITQEDMKWDTMKICIAIGLSLVFATTLSSLAFSMYLKIAENGKWSQLAFIGDYWAGHLGILSLALLMLSFYYQRNEFNLQKKELSIQNKMLDRQCKMLEADIRQQSGHFLLDSLKELSKNFEFFYSFSDNIQNIPQRGIPALRQLLIDEKMNSEELLILLDLRSLCDFISLARAAKETFKGLQGLDKGINERICKVLLPLEVEIYFEKLEQARNEQLENISKMKLPYRQSSRLTELVEAGWRIEQYKFRNMIHVSLIHDLKSEQYVSKTQDDQLLIEIFDELLSDKDLASISTLTAIGKKNQRIKETNPTKDKE